MDTLLSYGHGLDMKRLHARCLKQNDKETYREKKTVPTYTLHQAFDLFFEAFHQGLKQLYKIVRHHEKQLAEKTKKKSERNATNKQIWAKKSSWNSSIQQSGMQ